MGTNISKRCVGEDECRPAKWVACGRCEKYDECGIKADFCEGEKRGCFQEVKNGMES